jgi:hypothetical protein
MRRVALLGMLLAFAVAAAPGSAADGPTLEERAAAIEAASAEPDGMRVVLGHISRKLGIPVENLKTEHAQTGLNWGQLLVAHDVAREAGLAVEAVTAQFRLGKNWADIASDLHVDLARLTAEVQQSQEAIEQRSEDRARTGGPPSSGPRPAKGGGKGSGRRGGDR